MNKDVFSLIDFINVEDGIGNKLTLIKKVQKKFRLTKDRSIYYSEHYAIRFSYSSSSSFSNTVISLSNLQKYDDMPFLVCLVTPSKNILYLANTTFLHKVSHSSQELRVDNIRGSVNGSDIAKEFNGLSNSPENFDALFSFHSEIGFHENLVRLVEATNNINPSGRKFSISPQARIKIEESPERAMRFVVSSEYLQLKSELDSKVEKYKNEILIAQLIDNGNLRGRIIEYLILGEDDELRVKITQALNSRKRTLPKVKTKNDLGDYTRIFEQYKTYTDVKTKIILLDSCPKAYNIDKMFEFLSEDKSVFLFYVVGIEPNKITNKILISMFQVDLLKSTFPISHWAGRNSRGVTQLRDKVLNKLINSPNNIIDLNASRYYLNNLMKL